MTSPTFTVTFELVRNGQTPCVTFRPGGIGSVNDLTHHERAELIRHVRTILRPTR